MATASTTRTRKVTPCEPPPSRRWISPAASRAVLMPPRIRAVSCTIALALVSASAMVDAQLYKYRDASGAWVYTDREPPAGAKAETMTVDLAAKAPRITVEQAIADGQL